MTKRKKFRTVLGITEHELTLKKQREDFLAITDKLVAGAWKAGENEGFYAGVVASLAALAPFEEDTIYDEIMATMDTDKVIDNARRHGHLKWAGLDKYLKRREST